MEPNIDPNKPDALTLVQAGLQRLTDEQKAFKEEHIKALGELRDATKKEIEEKSAKGYDSPETKARIMACETAIANFEAKMLAPDGYRGGAPKAEKSASDQLTESEPFKNWKAHGFTPVGGRNGVQIKLGNAFFDDAAPQPFGEKSIITTGNIGSATSGVQNYQRQAGIIQIPRIQLSIRAILPPAIPMTTGNRVDYLKENVFTNGASPQVEGSAKAESTITYTTSNTDVKTIAHFMQASRQALDDLPFLRRSIDDNLMFGLKLVEEQQILAGNGVGASLSGIITNATAYNTGYNVSGDTKLDKLRHYILQSRLALYPVDGIVLSPRDLHDIELIKDGDVATFGRYILGDPRTGPEVLFIWGKPVVESDAISYGQALVGAFRTGVDLFDRQIATIDISLETGNNFVENEVTIRAEERLALAVKRAASFIYGAI